MAPQPFLGNEDSIIGPMSFATERPRLAALIAEIIGRWSHIEQEMGILMSRMFHTSAMAAVEIYLAIRNHRTQKDIIDKAAEATLTPDHYALFSAIRILARSCEKDRHPLAHHIFGYLRYTRDALLLVDPIHIIRGDVTAWINAGVLQLSSPQVMLYREKDLSEIIGRMDRVGHHLRRLHKVLDPNNPEAAQQYQSLCSEPDIAEVLSRLPDTKSSP